MKKDKKPGTTWVTFLRRTEDPKLTYVERCLDLAGIPHRRKGSSAHAPVLEVRAFQEQAAWKWLAGHLDDMRDDAPRFLRRPTGWRGFWSTDAHTGDLGTFRTRAEALKEARTWRRKSLSCGGSERTIWSVERVTWTPGEAGAR